MARRKMREQHMNKGIRDGMQNHICRSRPDRSRMPGTGSHPGTDGSLFLSPEPPSPTVSDLRCPQHPSRSPPSGPYPRGVPRSLERGQTREAEA